MFFGLLANDIGNGLVETNNSIVLDKVAGAILKRTKDLTVKVKVRTLGWDSDVITATVDGRVEGKVLAERLGRTRLDGSNVYTMLVLAMQSPWGEMQLEKLTVNASAVSSNSLGLFKVKSDVEDGLEVERHGERQMGWDVDVRRGE